MPMRLCGASAGLALPPRLGEKRQAMQPAPAPLRLRLDSAALVANYRHLSDLAGVPAVPAVKADGYGLGAREVVRRLEAAGARGFAVATWAEAVALDRPDIALLVLHGFTAPATAAAAALPHARPVLNTSAQIAAWAAAFPGRPADLMVETGMNRLGIAPSDVAAALAAVPIHTIHGHLACADEPAHPLTVRQLEAFRAVVAASHGHAHALANSAGIHWGQGFSFSAVRPGLGLFGGRPHPNARMHRVVTPEAQVLQVRTVPVGQTVGYGATWTAPVDSRVAILNIGYADGIPRAVAPHLGILAGKRRLPVAGVISMDMIATDCTGTDVAEGDWLALDWDLPALAAASGTSQYELLVKLGQRFERVWSD
jgi:alanine racemase